MLSSECRPEESSFRDPSGFVFYSGGKVYRQINIEYRDEYEALLGSGLYENLTKIGALVAHEEVVFPSPVPEKMFRIIMPERMQFVSYPYEWCFSQLKDAALLTLEVQKRALSFGMSLKDASAYNIQFRNAKPVFIDTLSFERYRKGKPWVAYRQFCQHFLAPLALMGLLDVRTGQMLKNHIDGIPLDLASALLPLPAFFKGGLFIHLLMHSKAQSRYAGSDAKKPDRPISEIAFRGLIDSLESTVRRLKIKTVNSEWGEYYQDTNYGEVAFQRKKEIVISFLEQIKGSTLWDLGANTGVFSRIASKLGYKVISIDSDVNAVENNYLNIRESSDAHILPLFMDLMNPSSDIGWANQERMSLTRRGPVDCVLFLALIHHLAISNNVPLLKIAEFLNKICRFLIIEFVPKADSQVCRLLASRIDIFGEYSQTCFEKAFARYFEIRCIKEIQDSKRTLYLMERIV